MNFDNETLDTIYFLSTIIGLCLGSVLLGFTLGWTLSGMSGDRSLPLIDTLDCRTSG